MLIIHKPQSFHKKLLLFGITLALSIGAILGFYALTYTPELSHAETVSSKKTIDDINYMQEMTPEICQSMELEKQYQLTDIRKNFDGSQPKYWISRLRDGNCWMTQNLDLDIPAEGLSTKDTDILNNWTAGVSPTLTGVLSSSATYVDSYSPGNYMYTTPSVMNLCGSSSTADLTSFESCLSHGWVTSGVYDTHYAIGNYYSWRAASAGYRGGQSPQSICPKGWRLPLGSPDNNKKGSFAYLLNSYGSFVKGTYSYGAQDVRLKPIALLAGGYMSQGRIGSVSYSGWYWSSTSGKTLYINGTNNSDGKIATDHSRSTDFGHQIRCVARTESIPNNNIEIMVNPTISLEVADEVKVEKGENNPVTAGLEVKVSSNQGYAVSMSADKTELSLETSSVTIPAKGGLLNMAENGWGIKLNDETNYRAITSTPATFYTASGAEVKTIPFIIGISTTPDLPNGEYSTDITVTATQN